MSEDLTKIGISMLRMGEVEEYLKAKNFAIASGTVEDTRNVAGVLAETIAIAVNSDQRDTVNNALHLNGRSAEDFLLASEGSKITSEASLSKNVYNDEIMRMKDELYQLRMELSKRGIVNAYKAYDGFYDSFRGSKPMHLDQPLATAIEDSPVEKARSTIKVMDIYINEFSVGDHIIIRSKSTAKVSMVGITEVGADGQTITFTPETDFAIKTDDAEIYKTKGSVSDGSFIFGETIAIRPGTKELFTALDDDTHWVVKRINAPHTGYAYTFRIPTSYQQNYLAKLQIKVKKYGDPGPLKCYIIRDTNITKWKSPAQARELGIILAESHPLNIDSKLDMHLTEFTFFDPNANKSSTRDSSDDPAEDAMQRSYINANPKNYPLLKDKDNQSDSAEKIRYCMIIEGMSNLDGANYYELTFLGNISSNSDLQINNTTYQYTEQADHSAQNSCVTNADINKYDLYYGITLMESIKQNFIPFTDGLYTARFKNSNNKKYTKARLMMRIAREGIFNVTGEGGTPGYGPFKDNGTFTIAGASAFDLDGFTHAVKKPIAIGTEIRKLEKVYGSTLTIDKGLYIEQNAPVYPIGYKATLKAYCNKWDPENCVMVKDEALGVKTYEMELTCIEKDQMKESELLSDRIIFEATFKDDLPDNKIFTDYELQIHWEKSAKELNTKLIGRIEDLVLTFSENV